jgi:hypothetical protein
MSHSAFVYSLSFQHCLSLQLLRPPRAISQHGESRAIRSFPTDAIQFKGVKATQSELGGSFKLSLCANVEMSLRVM